MNRKDEYGYSIDEDEYNEYVVTLYNDAGEFKCEQHFDSLQDAVDYGDLWYYRVIVPERQQWDDNHARMIATAERARLNIPWSRAIAARPIY